MDICDFCSIFKSHFNPYSTGNTIYSTPLELVYTDLWGPSLVFPLVSKSEVYSIFVKFQAQVERQLGRKMLQLQSDNNLSPLLRCCSSSIMSI